MSGPRTSALAWPAAFCVVPAWAQYGAGYTYVKMSLAVPWALYFVFLAGVLIPFVLMIVFAWRRDSHGDADARQGEDASQGEPR